MTSSLLDVLDAVEAVQAVEKLWKPQVYRDDVTFFSSQDIWVFIPSWDAKQCDVCGEYALGTPEYTGDKLRSIFPYLEIDDDATIHAMVHPNCRCILIRFSEYSKVKVM